MLHTAQVDFATYAPDEWLATADNSGNVRVWETIGYRAISPHLPHQSQITGLQFFPDQKRILTTTADRLLTIWDLPGPTSMSRKERNRLSRLLSRRTYNDRGELEQLSSSDLAAEWQSMRKDYPNRFKVSDDLVRRWREQQIVLARAQGNVFAEQYHRRYLHAYSSDANRSEKP